MSALRIALIAFFLSGGALAQTPGMGETRPTVPGSRDGSGPADAAIKGGSMKERDPAVEPGKREADSDRAISRCNQLSGTLREDCLRQERNAGAGGTRPSEPATAPPPQNPR
ncbi:MAG TPA: hypothetical protein VGJ74_08530 [Burkholderiales bacterium]